MSGSRRKKLKREFFEAVGRSATRTEMRDLKREFKRNRRLRRG